MVERRGARAMHAPRFLSHGNHALARRVRGGEVYMAQLGQSVSYSIVDRPFADFTAFDMRHGNPQSRATDAGARIS